MQSCRTTRPVARLPAETPAIDEIRRVVTIFRELRDGKTMDGKSKLKQPSSTLSTAEASASSRAASRSPLFGSGDLRARRGQRHVGAIVQIRCRTDRDAGVSETVIKERDGWKDRTGLQGRAVI